MPCLLMMHLFREPGWGLCRFCRALSNGDSARPHHENNGVLRSQRRAWVLYRPGRHERLFDSFVHRSAVQDSGVQEAPGTSTPSRDTPECVRDGALAPGLASVRTPGRRRTNAGRRRRTACLLATDPLEPERHVIDLCARGRVMHQKSPVLSGLKWLRGLDLNLEAI